MIQIKTAETETIIYLGKQRDHDSVLFIFDLKIFDAFRGDPGKSVFIQIGVENQIQPVKANRSRPEERDGLGKALFRDPDIRLFRCRTAVIVLKIFNPVRPLFRQDVENHILKIMVTAVCLAAESGEMNVRSAERHCFSRIQDQSVSSRLQAQFERKIRYVPITGRYRNGNAFQIFAEHLFAQMRRNRNDGSGIIVQHQLDRIKKIGP